MGFWDSPFVYMFIRYRKGKLISSGKAFRRRRMKEREGGESVIGEWSFGIFLFANVCRSHVQSLQLHVLTNPPWNDGKHSLFKTLKWKSAWTFQTIRVLTLFTFDILRFGNCSECECQQIQKGGKIFCALLSLSIFPKESSFLNPHLHCNGFMR